MTLETAHGAIPKARALGQQMAQFKKGQSDNPAGRRPGTIVQSVKLRKAIEADLPKIIKVLSKAVLDAR